MKLRWIRVSADHAINYSNTIIYNTVVLLVRPHRTSAFADFRFLVSSDVNYRRINYYGIIDSNCSKH